MAEEIRIPDWLEAGRSNIASFERTELHEDLRSHRRDWWTQAFEADGEVLLGKIEALLSEAKAEPNGCLTLQGKSPKRLVWKGQRQYAYQLVCIGLGGVLPAEKDVVRHLCHNRCCINPDHLKLGKQGQNIMDERLRRYRGG